MHIYTNSAELDAQFERGISNSSAEKIYVNSVNKLTTFADRLLDNHVVISERVTGKSAQSSQKMGFRWITPQSRVCRNTFCKSCA